jgi:GT2 family glycosyltransferase
MSTDLSICIPTRAARTLLRDCLLSIYANTSTVSFEIIVVDNDSRDGTVEMLQSDFAAVHLIANDYNAGFTRPTNQALKSSHGRYALLLNNDTVILPGALDRLVEFADAHPDIGIFSPKVLNRDRTLLKQCRRGLATPWELFCYFSGLAARFPNDPKFAGYLVTYIGEDETHPVAAVSGSCMLVRRAVLEQIGLLDERFFAYQEDTDFCYRAGQAGWLVYYYPQAQILHLAGQGGSRSEPYRSIWEWHRSYFLYYRKNLAHRYFFLFNWFYYFVMALKLASALGVNFFREEKFAGSRKP